MVRKGGNFDDMLKLNYPDVPILLSSVEYKTISDWILFCMEKMELFAYLSNAFLHLIFENEELNGSYVGLITVHCKYLHTDNSRPRW